MRPHVDKIKPAVEKRVLILLSGMVWIVVGTILLTFAYSWLQTTPISIALRFTALGFAAALLIHHFGFLKIVDKNLGRILPMEGKKCAFSFMTWKSYLIVLVMVTMGIVLRHSPIPKSYLAILYVGIGLALILSSVRYIRYFIRFPSPELT